MTGGSFTVGAGNMNGFKFFMRVIQCGTKGNGIGKIRLKCRRANTAVHRKFRKKIVERLLVGHGDTKIGEFLVCSFQFIVPGVEFLHLFRENAIQFGMEQRYILLKLLIILIRSSVCWKRLQHPFPKTRLNGSGGPSGF